jgi:carbonic anhydrase
MNNTRYLSRMLNGRKTLLISCIDCRLDMTADQAEHVFVYTTLGNMLNQGDEGQRNCVLFHLEQYQCSQIIVAGHCQCRAMDYLLNKDSQDVAIQAYQCNLQALLKTHHGELLRKNSRKQMLIEQNVIEQSRLLMEYDFVKQRVEKGSLQVLGLVVAEQTNQHTTVFRNGFSFNNQISMN